ncbi:tetratricopeptide repeat protein [Actinoplanes octamycinicus]|uniref:tetratricopeptide repeat protein n=1 Tax=Actinoplanes octamycinicus TaxID=135948 RepID=UPI0035E61A8E
MTPALERAHSLVAAGDLAGAAEMLERAVEIGQATLSQGDPDVLATQRELAAVHHQRGDAAAARGVLEAAYGVGRFSLGDDDPLMLQISYDLGVVAEELGQRDEARAAFGRVADHGPMMLGAGHWAVTRAQAYLGQDPTTPFRVEPAHQMPQGGLTIPAVPAAEPQQPLVTPPDAQPTVIWPAQPGPANAWTSTQPPAAESQSPPAEAWPAATEAQAPAAEARSHPAEAWPAATETQAPAAEARSHPAEAWPAATETQAPAAEARSRPAEAWPAATEARSATTDQPVASIPAQAQRTQEPSGHGDQPPRTLPAPAELPAWLQKPEAAHGAERADQAEPRMATTGESATSQVTERRTAEGRPSTPTEPAIPAQRQPEVQQREVQQHSEVQQREVQQHPEVLQQREVQQHPEVPQQREVQQPGVQQQPEEQQQSEVRRQQPAAPAPPSPFGLLPPPSALSFPPAGQGGSVLPPPLNPPRADADRAQGTAQDGPESFRPESPWGPAPRTGKEPEESPFQQFKPETPETAAPPALYHRGANDSVVVQRPDPVIMPLGNEPDAGPRARPDSITAGDPVPGQSPFPVRPEHPPVTRPESVTPGVSAPPGSATAESGVPDRVTAPADAKPAAPGPWSGEPQTRHPQPPSPLTEPTAKQHTITPARVDDQPAADGPAAKRQPTSQAGVYRTGDVQQHVGGQPGTVQPPTPQRADLGHQGGVPERPVSGAARVYQSGETRQPVSGPPGIQSQPVSPPPGVYRTGDLPHQVSAAPSQPVGYQPIQPGVYQQGHAAGQQAFPYGPSAHQAGYQQSGTAGVYEQGQQGVYHQGEGGVWQHGPGGNATASALSSYEKSQEAQPAANRKRGMALFAVIAATLAAVVAVAAMVFTLAQRTQEGEEGDTGGNSPALAGNPPTGVKLSDLGTKIDVSWTDPANATASFMVTMAHPGEQLKPVSTVGPGQTSRRIEGLSSSLEYCFAVVAVYATNKFATSAQVCTDRGKK